MNIKTFFSTLLLLCVMITSAQNEKAQDNTIEAQFVRVIDMSNNYQEYKVIRRSKLAALRKNILDSLAALEIAIQIKDAIITSQSSNISTLEVTLNSTQNNLNTSKAKEDTIALFGITTKKGSYNFILFSIISFLLLGLFFFILKFKNSNTITKETNHKLSEIERAFENYRQKKLEDEQILRRKLQDEINKKK
ncbi:MAG: hypothetical protein ACI9RL_000915 [Candidatus Paceibacteria bacterium]|jgi:hypothetical protein